MLSITPDVDMTTKIMVDGEETEVVIPITVRFFWPSTGSIREKYTNKYSKYHLGT